MRHVSGFTLIELMVTLAVAAVLATVAVPAFDNFIKSSRRSSSANALLSGFHLARSEAIKRRQRVSICKSNGGADCDNGASWSDGWIVMTDSGAPLSLDGGDEVLHHQGPGAESGFTLSSTIDGFTYRSQGDLNSFGGTILLCDSDTDPVPGREIILNRTGRPRIEEDDADADATKNC